MKTIRAVHREYGVPCEVLNAEEADIGSPASGQVLIRLLRASVNPSDMGMIGGSYGRLRPLPAIAGREAVGEVVGVADGVKNVKSGDIVRIPEEPGAWSQYNMRRRRSNGSSKGLGFEHACNVVYKPADGSFDFGGVLRTERGGLGNPERSGFGIGVFYDSNLPQKRNKNRKHAAQRKGKRGGFKGCGSRCRYRRSGV